MPVSFGEIILKSFGEYFITFLGNPVYNKGLYTVEYVNELKKYLKLAETDLNQGTALFHVTYIFVYAFFFIVSSSSLKIVSKR